MNAREARTEFRKERLTVEQVFDLLEKQEQTIHRLQAEIDRVKQRLAQYEPEIQSEGKQGDPPSDAATRYSLEAEEKRRRRRRKKKKSPGRRKTHLKFAEAERTKDIYPDNVRRADCELARERAVWRLEDGRAVLVGYRVFRGPNGVEGRIPGVTKRCEYGIEILVVLSFLVYVIGISLEKACVVLRFFCRLPLSKSQADALLRQLAQHWEAEFDTLCDLLVHATVVYMDETGWKVGTEGCSLWTFASKFQRVFLFGCRKDGDTLDQMLPPDLFDGVGVSDDAAVYRRRFVQAQKCWAHLLRKAIRLALLYPRKRTYQRFLDQLLQLFYDAKRAAADQRLGLSGREKRVAELEGRLCGLCNPHSHQKPDMRPHERDFANLANELLERMMDEELFTFVLNPEVEATNNLPERLQRSPAQDRKAGRTSKTAAGARRRSVIVSVLESLRVNLPEFTLDRVLEEVQRWMTEGISLFTRQWQEITDASTELIFDTG
jgi:hypothetical protein